MWGNAVFPAAMAATGFFGALFTRSFLETRRTAPGLDKLILVGVAWFAIAAIGPFVLPYRIAAINVSLSGISFSLLAVAGGVLCLMRKGPGAHLFLVAWALLLIGVAVTGARNFGWVPTNALTSYAMQIGSALEMLLLSSALADRINSMRKEKERAQADSLAAKQQMVIALQGSELDLEERVADRTRELADANTRLEESQEALRHLAYHDNLTGLANRALMEDRIAQAIEHARRYDFVVAVLLVDLDRFKPINDSYGHSAGDEVLNPLPGGSRIACAPRTPWPGSAAMNSSPYSTSCMLRKTRRVSRDPFPGFWQNPLSLKAMPSGSAPVSESRSIRRTPTMRSR